MGKNKFLFLRGIGSSGLEVTQPFRRANGEWHGENGRSPCRATKLLMNGRAYPRRLSNFFFHLFVYGIRKFLRNSKLIGLPSIFCQQPRRDFKNRKNDD